MGAATWLENERILLRALEPEDLEFLNRIENDSRLWHLSNTLAPYSKYVLRQYIENSGQDIYEAKQLRLLIVLKERPQRAVGAIDLFDFDPYHQRAGVGIVVLQDEQGAGIAGEALELLKEYCFDFLKLHQLYCNITAQNLASLRLFEKAGFQKQSLKKDWIHTAEGWLDEWFLQCIPISLS